MMRDIVAAVEEEMDINSPSKVFARIGSYMAQGLGEGFAREMRDVESSIRRETSTPFRNSVPERDATRAAAVRLPLKSCKTSMRTKRATPNSKDRRRGSSGRLRGRLWHEDTRKIDLHERARGKHRVFPASSYHVNFKDVTGLSDVRNAIYSTNSMGQDGDTYLGYRIESRSIDIVGYIKERDKQAAQNLRRKLNRILNRSTKQR